MPRAQERTSPVPPPQPSSTPVSFNRQILPILADNCFACHGPDEKARKTRFHFDTEDGALAKARRHRAGKRRPRAC